MKKQILLFLMALLPVVAWGVEVKVDGIYYDYYFDSPLNHYVASVIKDPSDKLYAGDIIIPPCIYINGKEECIVNSIGRYAFYGCIGLTSVSIPSSITTIGEGAFSGSSLTSLSIPASVTTINDFAFYRCEKITSVTIPESVTTIGKEAFAECVALTSVTLPSSVANLGYEVFWGCKGLTSITLLSNINNLGEKVFYGCERLNDVYCYTEKVPWIESSEDGTLAFESSRFENSTLHVPSSKINEYRSTIPWKYFKTIVTLDDEDTFDAEFRYHGQSLEDGAVVTIPGVVDPVWGDIECNTNPAADAINGLVFANTSNKEMKCTAKLTIESNTMDPSQIQWCMGGQCTLVTGTTITKDFTAKAGGVTMVQFDCLPTRDGALDALLEVTSNKKTYTVRIRFVNNAPEPAEQCAKPLIYYNDGQLSFTSETEGANFSYTIKDTDVKSGLASVVDLSVTYTIEVRATKAGFADSDVATATLSWIDVDPKKEGITDDEDPIVTGMKEQKAVPVLIQRDGNQLSVSGAPAGTPIAIYDLSGRLLGNAMATDGTTKVDVESSASILIVKVGERSVKVAR